MLFEKDTHIIVKHNKTWKCGNYFYFFCTLVWILKVNIGVNFAAYFFFAFLIKYMNVALKKKNVKYGAAKNAFQINYLLFCCTVLWKK
jgi:hypothetical protein